MRAVLSIAIASSLILTGCSNAQQKNSISNFLGEQTSMPYESSMVRVKSTSDKCKLIEHGSGFVVKENLIATNAHVVAGATQVVVSSDFLNGEKSAIVVYFDPRKDLAILKVEDLKLQTLAIGGALEDNEEVSIYGFTSGKILRVEDSFINRSFTWAAKDIFGSEEFDLRVYELKAHISTGDSGGPLIDSAGQVRGVVFGKSSDKNEVAYAIQALEITEALKKVDTGVKVSNSRCLPKN